MALIKLNNNSLSAVTALPAGVGGKVLQIVTNTWNSGTTISSSSPQSVDLTDSVTSITPSSTSSKIFITGFIGGSWSSQDHCGIILKNQINGGGYNSITAALGTGATGSYEDYHSGGFKSGQHEDLPINYVDSPNTTSQVDYRFTVQKVGGVVFTINNGRNGYTHSKHASTVTLMEISS